MGTSAAILAGSLAWRPGIAGVIRLPHHHRLSTRHTVMLHSARHCRLSVQHTSMALQRQEQQHDDEKRDRFWGVESDHGQAS